MEYIYVKYWRRRTVIVDGQRWGMTNTSLPVAEGRRHVELSPPDNYRPPEQTPLVRDTTPQFPLEIEFRHESQP